MGPAGAAGTAGPKGDQGQVGPVGPVGPSQYAEFYALMPPDNAATVAVGGAVAFPQDGPQQGGIVRSGGSDHAFVLPNIGTYRVAFNVSVTEDGQLELTLDSGSGAVALPSTVFGRATATSEITGEALVTTTAADSVISVVNPAGNSHALTITSSAGGTHPSTASLIIEQLGRRQLPLVRQRVHVEQRRVRGWRVMSGGEVLGPRALHPRGPGSSPPRIGNSCHRAALRGYVLGASGSGDGGDGSSAVRHQRASA